MANVAKIMPFAPGTPASASVSTRPVGSVEGGSARRVGHLAVALNAVTNLGQLS